MTSSGLYRVESASSRCEESRNKRRTSTVFDSSLFFKSGDVPGSNSSSLHSSMPCIDDVDGKNNDGAMVRCDKCPADSHIVGRRFVPQQLRGNNGTTVFEMERN